MAEKYMVITIDTECDKNIDWINSNPLKFDSVLYGIPEILQPLFSRYGVKPTYLISSEVLERPDCISIFKNIVQSCELGTHLHADFIEPQKRFDDFSGKLCDDFQTDYEEDIEFEKLSNITKLFHNSLGYKPKVFRSGRFASNQNTIDSLIKLGYFVDTSVTPHLKWKNRNGKVISYENFAEQPYFVNNSISDKILSNKFLEIPVTIHKSFILNPYRRIRWLRPRYSSSNMMINIIKAYTKKYSMNNIIIFNMMFHSMEVIPNASPNTKSLKDVLKYTGSLDRVFHYCANNSIRFCGLEDVYNELIKLE